MSWFDRFDICEAYCVLEWDYNADGILQERPSCARRRESVGVQLSRMGFAPGMGLCFDSLSENGKMIYIEAVQRLNLPMDEQLKSAAVELGYDI